MSDRLQPRLRADVAEHHGRPEPDGRLGARERPAGDVHVRPADVSGRPERRRTIPIRARIRPASSIRSAARRTTRSRPRARPSCRRRNPNKQFDLDGTPCPANKLVITPSSPIPSGATFVVQVNYAGRPGVHNDGDGTTEGWFRVGTAGRPRQLRHDRAGRDRGLDAAERPPEREADLRLLRHRSGRQDGDRQRRARLAAGEPARRELRRRVDDLALALARRDRVVPRREQHRLVRPERPPRRERHPVLRGAGPRDPDEQGGEQGDHGHAGGHPNFQSGFNGTLPVHDGRRGDRRPERRLRRGDADEDHLRQRAIDLARRSTTRTCTSGGATTSPRRTTT